MRAYLTALSSLSLFAAGAAGSSLVPRLFHLLFSAALFDNIDHARACVFFLAISIPVSLPGTGLGGIFSVTDTESKTTEIPRPRFQ